MTAAQRALLAFANTSPKITGGGISPDLQALLDVGFMEPAPYDKAGLMGDGWQITAAGQIALLNEQQARGELGEKS